MKFRMALTGVAGAAATVGTAAAYRMPLRDPVEIGAIGLGTALGAGVVGLLVLRALRGRPIGLQMTIVSLTAVLAAGSGAAVAAKAMAFAKPDLHALLVILVAAGTAGVITAMALGHRVSRDARAIREAARRIGDRVVAPATDTAETGELVALARELDATTARLEQARLRELALDTSRRELVAWVSHDIRTPLAGMRAIVEALVDGIVTDAETIARYHATLRRETDRLSSLVDDLFELSRIQAGALNLHLERVSLCDIVSDAIAAADPVARSKGIHVQGRVPDVATAVDASTPELTRALMNILTNAIRHTPSDGRVRVEAGRERDTAFVSVADECGGIPEEDLARVFDPAFRGERARTPGSDGGAASGIRPWLGTGAGLGLAIARGFVEAHHGEIVARNIGRGCRFTVRIPLSPAV